MVRHPEKRSADTEGDQFAAYVCTLVLHEAQLRQLLFISPMLTDMKIQFNRISRLQLT